MPAVALAALSEGATSPYIVIVGQQCIVNPHGRTRLQFDDSVLGVDVTVLDKPPKKRSRELQDFYCRPGSPVIHDGFAPSILFGLTRAWNAHMLSVRPFKGSHMMFLASPRPWSRRRFGYWIVQIGARGVTPVIGVLPQVHYRQGIELPSGRPVIVPIIRHWHLQMFGINERRRFATDFDAVAHAVTHLVAQRILR